MNNKLILMLFSLTFIISNCAIDCSTNEHNPNEDLSALESARAKDGEHGASSQMGANAQNGENGENGKKRQNGGNGGNGGNSWWGKAGDGGNGGDAD
jgi:hypothetical protein